jgi:tRNA(Ile)-lysidine synthase
LIKGISKKSFTKITLGGCFVDRVNETILISKES